MFLTGRFPLLVAVGAVPVVLLSAAGVDAWAATAGWVLLCTLIAYHGRHHPFEGSSAAGTYKA